MILFEIKVFEIFVDLVRAYKSADGCLCRTTNTIKGLNVAYTLDV